MTMPEHYAGGIVMAEARYRRKQEKSLPRYTCFNCGKLFFTGKQYYVASRDGCPQCGCTEINFSYKVKAR